MFQHSKHDAQIELSKQVVDKFFEGSHSFRFKRHNLQYLSLARERILQIQSINIRYAICHFDLDMFKMYNITHLS